MCSACWNLAEEKFSGEAETRIADREGVRRRLVIDDHLPETLRPVSFSRRTSGKNLKHTKFVLEAETSAHFNSLLVREKKRFDALHKKSKVL
jgi:hypothetical protein